MCIDRVSCNVLKIGSFAFLIILVSAIAVVLQINMHNSMKLKTIFYLFDKSFVNSMHINANMQIEMVFEYIFSFAA